MLKEILVIFCVVPVLSRSFLFDISGFLKQELKKQLKKTKNPEEVDELKNRLTYVVRNPFFSSPVI